jgi:hypothetical protein
MNHEYPAPLSIDYPDRALNRSGSAFAVTGDPRLSAVTIDEPDGQHLTLPAPGPFAPAPARAGAPPTSSDPRGS